MKKGGAGLGAITLVMFFSVLCLTVFAVLSLSSARAELGLTDRYVGSVQGYYEADTFATVVLSRLLNAGDLMEEAEAIRRELDLEIKVAQNQDGIYEASYTREIGETLSLVVALEFLEANADERTRQVNFVSWELLDSADWKENDRLEVWDGT